MRAKPNTAARVAAATAIPSTASATRPRWCARREVANQKGKASRRIAIIVDTCKNTLLVSRSPRYDVPKAAPPPLRLIQEFINTVDLENEREWLATPADLLAWGRER